MKRHEKRERGKWREQVLITSWSHPHYSPTHYVCNICIIIQIIAILRWCESSSKVHWFSAVWECSGISGIIRLGRGWAVFHVEDLFQQSCPYPLVCAPPSVYTFRVGVVPDCDCPSWPALWQLHCLKQDSYSVYLTVINNLALLFNWKLIYKKVSCWRLNCLSKAIFFYCVPFFWQYNNY